MLISASGLSEIFLYRVQTPFWMSVCVSVTYLLPVSSDTKKKMISALNKAILCQEFSVSGFLIFV